MQYPQRSLAFFGNLKNFSDIRKELEILTRNVPVLARLDQLLGVVASYGTWGSETVQHSEQYGIRNKHCTLLARLHSAC